MSNIDLDHQHVRVIDSVLSREFCQHLITKFEHSAACHHHRPGGWAKLIELNLNSTQNQLMPQHRGKPWSSAKGMGHSDFTEDCKILQSATIEQARHYRSHWDPLNQMPEAWSMEAFRIKCYRPNGEHEFKLHVDAASRESCTRFLAFLYYLSDSDAGTEFPQLGLTVQAKQGRLLIFPPTWQYPHRGLMPGDRNSKYICSTYLHFADE